MYGPDGKLSRVWANYLDEQAQLQAASTSGLSGVTTSLSSLQGEVDAVEVRATSLESAVRELRFLGA